MPAESHDKKVRAIMDRILLEEEYAGYAESTVYRMLGIGPMLSEAVLRMVREANNNNNDDNNSDTSHDRDRTTPPTPEEKETVTTAVAPMSLFGCHDSTLAATLASLGALQSEAATWPAFTSSLAIELFRVRDEGTGGVIEGSSSKAVSPPPHYVRLLYKDRP